jgi:hypothetical protein
VQDGKVFSSISSLPSSLSADERSVFVRMIHRCRVSPTSYDTWVRIRNRLEWICENRQRPDAAIWEMRNRQEQFVYSKVMNWVALDRGLRLADWYDYWSGKKLAGGQSLRRILASGKTGGFDETTDLSRILPFVFLGDSAENNLRIENEPASQFEMTARPTRQGSSRSVQNRTVGLRFQF